METLETSRIEHAVLLLSDEGDRDGCMMSQVIGVAATAIAAISTVETCEFERVRKRWQICSTDLLVGSHAVVCDKFSRV